MMIKKILFVFLYLFIFSNLCFAEPEVGEQKRLINIRDIKISGNLAVSEFEIRENILLKEQTYEINKFHDLTDKSLKILYSMNKFKNINFTIDQTDTQILYLEIEELPIIDSFEIIGLNNIKSGKDDTETIEKVNEKVDYIRGEFISENRNNQIIAKIRAHLMNEGYYYCRVTPIITKLSETKNRAKLIFDVYEGPQIKVKYVNIYGKERFGRLTKFKMKYKMKVDAGDIFKTSEFENDINMIKIGLWNQGHINSKVIHDLVNYNLENKMGINIYIEKGKQYKVKDFTVSGNVFFDNDKLLKLIKLEKNKFFNYDNYMESVKAITDVYSEEGYLETRVEPEQKFVGENEVVFDFRITEGEKLYIENILIHGNIKTREKVIRREILVKSGDVMNSKQIDLSRRNLIMLNFFDRVDLKVLDGTKPHHKVLLFEVEEGRTGTLSFGAGYSSVDKFVGFVEISKNNFDAKDLWSFTGKGQKVSARVEYGKSRKNYEIGWSDPWFNDDVNDTVKPSPDKPLYLGYNVYRITRSPDDYEIQRTGGNVSVGRRLGVYNRVFLRYKIEEVKIYDVNKDLAPSDIWAEVENLPGNKKREIQSSVTLEFTRNTTDSPRWPTLGYILTLSTQLSGGFIGGDIDYNKNEFDLSYFIPSINTKLGRQVIALRYNAGTVNNPFSSSDIPSYEKYFLGGSNTIRGYKDRSIKIYNYDLGTYYTYGGRTQMFFNFEYRIPLVKDTISTVLFYDGGNLTNKEYSMTVNKWKFGYGFGFRINTPMGLLRLDWARRINETYPGAGDAGQSDIHFNIGNMF